MLMYTGCSCRQPQAHLPDCDSGWADCLGPVRIPRGLHQERAGTQLCAGQPGVGLQLHGPVRCQWYQLHCPGVGAAGCGWLGSSSELNMLHLPVHTAYDSTIKCCSVHISAFIFKCSKPCMQSHSLHTCIASSFTHMDDCSTATGCHSSLQAGDPSMQPGNYIHTWVHASADQHRLLRLPGGRCDD